MNYEQMNYEQNMNYLLKIYMYNISSATAATNGNSTIIITNGKRQFSVWHTHTRACRSFFTLALIYTVMFYQM